MAEKKAQTEFGRGLVTCLLYFANHWDNQMMERALRIYRVMEAPEREPAPDLQREIDIYGGPDHALSAAIVSWANGATDHLYEIKTPSGVQWAEVANKVALLQKLGLEMGHGFVEQRLYTMDDVLTLERLAKEIALKIDTILGVDPDAGEWQ